MAFDPNTPLLLTQLGRGAMVAELQERFEKAQREAMAEGVSAKLTLEIAILPPEPGDLTGAIGWQTGISYGKKKHKSVSTLVNTETGLIYADGAGDPRQLGMFDMETERVDPDTGEVLSPANKPAPAFSPRRSVNG